MVGNRDLLEDNDNENQTGVLRIIVPYSCFSLVFSSGFGPRSLKVKVIREQVGKNTIHY